MRAMNGLEELRIKESDRLAAVAGGLRACGSEVVEHENDTPRIDASDLQKLVDAGTDLVILDSRPMPEFHNMSIPGGID